MPAIPHEVLLSIFEHLDDKSLSPLPYGGKTSPFLPLLSVCRLWRVLAETFLYSRITLDLRMRSKTSRRCSRLVYNLQQQTARIRYVKELNLALPSEYGDGWQKLSSSVNDDLDLVQIISWFTGHIEKLSLEGTYSEGLGQPLLLAIARLQPRSLTVYETWCDFLLDHLLFWGDGENLQEVTIGNFPWCFHEPYRIHLNASRPLPLDRQYSSKLSAINIYCFGPPFNYFNNLFLWPVALRSLTLHTTTSELRSLFIWTSNDIQRLLYLHKDTLETIELGRYGKLAEPSAAGSVGLSSEAIPDFSSFPQLHTVNIKAFNLLSMTSQSANMKLAAPALRHLIIDFDPNYYHMKPTRFNSEFCTWLADFASYKAEYYPFNNLRSIYINVVVDGVPWSQGHDYSYGPPSPPVDLAEPYPYIPLQQLKPILQSLGIDLSWPTPSISESEWKERLSRFGGRGGWPEDSESCHPYTSTRYAWSDDASTVSGCKECENDSDHEDCTCDERCDNDREEFDAFEFATSTRPDTVYEEGQQRICQWLLQSTECLHECLQHV